MLYSKGQGAPATEVCSNVLPRGPETQNTTPGVVQMVQKFFGPEV